MAQSTCTVNNCTRPIHNKTHQLCDPHYKRLWRSGDVQADIPIPEPRKAPEPVRDFDGGTRECQSCRERLPLERFHNDKRAPGGKRKTCKACRIKVEVERYASEPERHRMRMAQYRQGNLEKVRQADMERYQRDKPKRIALAIANSHVRRARIQGNDYDRGVTVPALRKRDGDRCYYCAARMKFKSYKKGERPDNQATLEHMQPISKGGAHTWDNCVLACWRCNISKGTRGPEFWTLIA